MSAETATKTVYLHIGTMKSGTTYLQGVLDSNRAALAEQSVLWPGRNWGEQVDAGRDLADINPRDYRPEDVAGSWQRLVDEIHAWDGHSAVISMELLAASAQLHHIQHAVETLAPAEVHVILTGRDLARNIPAAWQEGTQNWRTASWEPFIEAVRDPESATIGDGKRVWRQQDLGSILRRWNEVIPKDRMHVVTVPPPGADAGALWQRFASVLGINPDDYIASVKGANASLGVVSAELMRRLNMLSHKRGMGWRNTQPLFKRILSKQVLSQRKGKEPVLVLPEAHWPWVIEQSKRIVAEVEQAGVQIWGDLDELVPDLAHAREGTTPEAIDDGELLEAALEGIVGLVDNINGKIHTAEQLQELKTLQLEQEQRAEASATDVVKRCLVELAQRVGWIGVLYRLWLAARHRVRMVARS